MIFILLLVMNFVWACTSSDRNGESQLDINMGLDLDINGPNPVPSIMWIKIGAGHCSSTAVSDNTMIFAAHCTKHSKTVCIEDSWAKGICSSNVFTMKNISVNFMDSNTQQIITNWDSGRDLAVAVFPRGTFKSINEIADTSLQVDQEVLLVGYSYLDGPVPSQDPFYQKNGRKRWGLNTIEATFESDPIALSQINNNNFSKEYIFSVGGFDYNNVTVSPGPSEFWCLITG